MIRIPLPGPLLLTRFVERPNRFLVRCAGAPRAPTAPADGRAGGPDCVTANGGVIAVDEVVEAHLADPGRLRELLIPGRRVWLRRAVPAPGRRTHWTAVLVESPDGNGLVSVDTTLPNRLIRAALQAGALDEFAGWRLERHEVLLGRSRLDFLLADGNGRRLALEVKSVTLVEDGVALFPDAVTARGVRHLRELERISREPGWEAAVLFVAQRPDARRILAAAEIDPAFAAALADAMHQGVRVLGRRCTVALDHVALGERVPAG
jgi:sugar fermentation stimulation protein A